MAKKKKLEELSFAVKVKLPAGMSKDEATEMIASELRTAPDPKMDDRARVRDWLERRLGGVFMRAVGTKAAKAATEEVRNATG